jgi:site-specific recombinase XerD
MSTVAPRALFPLVESFFVEYLPRQRGASVHTVRAYRDALKLLFEFVAQRLGRGVAALELSNLDADAVASFLDHVESRRQNSAATRNCRRAAIRSFFKHLVRNDLARSQQYTRVLAIPSKSPAAAGNLPRSRRCACDHWQARPADCRWMARLHAPAVPLQLWRPRERSG